MSPPSSPGQGQPNTKFRVSRPHQVAALFADWADDTSVLPSEVNAFLIMTTGCQQAELHSKPASCMPCTPINLAHIIMSAF